MNKAGKIIAKNDTISIVDKNDKSWVDFSSNLISFFKNTTISGDLIVSGSSFSTVLSDISNYYNITNDLMNLEASFNELITNNIEFNPEITLKNIHFKGEKFPMPGGSALSKKSTNNEFLTKEESVAFRATSCRTAPFTI